MSFITEGESLVPQPRLHKPSMSPSPHARTAVHVVQTRNDSSTTTPVSTHQQRHFREKATRKPKELVFHEKPARSALSSAKLPQHRTKVSKSVIGSPKRTLPKKRSPGHSKGGGISFHMTKGSVPAKEEKPRVEGHYDIEFPTLRSVLWDRRVLGEPIVLGPECHIPSLSIRRAVFASIYNQFDSKVNESKNLSSAILLGKTKGMNALGSIGSWVGGRWSIEFDKVGAEKCQGEPWIEMLRRTPRGEDVEFEKGIQKAGGRGMAGYEAIVDRSDRCMASHMSFTPEELEQILTAADEKFLQQGPPHECQYFSFHGVCSALPNARVLVRLEVLVPSVTLAFSQLGPVPILSTPLSRYLQRKPGAGPSTAESDSKFHHGLLTLNHTRQVVMLLRDDPEAYRLPLVGIWLSQTLMGLAEGAPDWHNALSHPVTRAHILHYLHNEYIAERAGPADSPLTFLVMLVNPASGTIATLECTPSLDTEGSYGTLGTAIPMSRFETGFEVEVAPPSGKLAMDAAVRLDAVNCKFHIIENVERRMQGRAHQDKYLFPPPASSAPVPANDTPTSPARVGDEGMTSPPRYTDGILRTPPKLPILSFNNMTSVPNGSAPLTGRPSPMFKSLLPNAGSGMSQRADQLSEDPKEAILIAQQEQIKQLTAQVARLSDMLSTLMNGTDKQQQLEETSIRNPSVPASLQVTTPTDAASVQVSTPTDAASVQVSTPTDTASPQATTPTDAASPQATTPTSPASLQVPTSSASGSLQTPNPKTSQYQETLQDSKLSTQVRDPDQVLKESNSHGSTTRTAVNTFRMSVPSNIELESSDSSHQNARGVEICHENLQHRHGEDSLGQSFESFADKPSVQSSRSQSVCEVQVTQNVAEQPSRQTEGDNKENISTVEVEASPLDRYEVSQVLSKVSPASSGGGLDSENQLVNDTVHSSSETAPDLPPSSPSGSDQPDRHESQEEISRHSKVGDYESQHISRKGTSWSKKHESLYGDMNTEMESLQVPNIHSSDRKNRSSYKVRSYSDYSDDDEALARIEAKYLNK